MNQSIKISLLAAAVFIAVALVMAFYNTIVSPPRELSFKNQYVPIVNKDIESTKTKSNDKELDTAYTAVLHELCFMLKESRLSANEHDELKESFVKAYVPQYVAVCNHKFSQSVWNEVVLKQMQSHVKEIQSLTTSDNKIIAGGDINTSLNEVNNTILRYYGAKSAAAASGYRGLNSARERIKTAQNYAQSSPISNCRDLVKKLNTVADRLNNAHVKHLASRVDVLATYYYQYPQYQFNDLSKEIYQEVIDYRNNAKSVYGSVKDLNSIDNTYTQYCRNANQYYQSKQY